MYQPGEKTVRGKKRKENKLTKRVLVRIAQVKKNCKLLQRVEHRKGNNTSHFFFGDGKDYIIHLLPKKDCIISHPLKIPD